MLLPAPFDIFIERGGSYDALIITAYDDLPPLDTPDAPTVTPHGTAGVITWTYKVVARNTLTERFSAVSTGGTTTIGNATLTTTNYNIISWEAVDDANIYDVYRTTAGGTPATLGLIGSTFGLIFNDTGVAGDGTTAPVTGGPGVVVNLTGYSVHAQARRIPDDTLLKDLDPEIVAPATAGQIKIGPFTNDETLVFKPVVNGKWSLVLETPTGEWQPAIVAGAYSATYSVTRDQL